MPDLLIELLSEEIPARMQAKAAEDLRRLLTDGLVEAGLTYAHAASFATPRTAPGWFDCFDAEAIGDAIESGEARAYLGTKDVRYGIDRIVAILPDGRGFAWHDINACGEVVFDGDPAPEGCPPVPERLE